MAKFHGIVGFVDTVETSPGSGIFSDNSPDERTYYGDVLRTSVRAQLASGVNDDVVSSNKISIIADKFAIDNILKIRYVVWMNIKWKVRFVDPELPRLVLNIGDVYNGN